MKSCQCLVFTIIILIGCRSKEHSGVAIKRDNRPNIVFILADDQRNDALGCAGHPIIKTPVIDNLADGGLRFINAFVTTPICAASRATILTGLVERSHGYTFGKEKLSQSEMDLSYPVLLKKSGYRTGFFGKFGVQMDYDADSLFDSYSFRDRPYHTPEGHIDELNTREALAFIDSNSEDKPFCLSISYSSAHAEDGDHIPGEQNHFAVIDELKGKYRNMEIPEPRLHDPAIFNRQPDFLKNSLNRVRYHWRWDTPEKYRENIKAYYGLISGIDFMVGQILEKIRQKGIEENTIIIYMADNGYYMGDRGFAGKWSHYEESLRVPLIIYDPRQKNETRSKLIDEIVLNLDIPATILDYAQIKVPKNYQGKSLLSFFKNEEISEWRKDFFCEHLMEHQQIPKWEGVRDSRYVYAKYFDEVPAFEFLHDLDIDPDQLVNYRDDDSYDDVLQKMRKRNEELRESYTVKE